MAPATLLSEPLALHGGRPRVHSAEHVRWPVLGAAERRAVLAVLDRGVLSGHHAPEVRGLEREFAAFVGSKYCLATNSGTAALHIALAAAGVGPGDEVLVPAFTFVATALAVLHHNAIPVFVDVEPRTLGMDPALVEAAITDRTRALLPVHMHGVPCDVGPLAEIAARRHLALIEDAAQAHGARYRDKMVGTLGAAGCFSLQSSKNLTSGEGGLLVTDDEALYRRARQVRMFGEESPLESEASYTLEHALDANRDYDATTMGWMYRTTELSASVARAQLQRLPEWNARALANAEMLSRRLRQLPGVSPPEVPEDRTPAFHKYRVRLDAAKLGIHAPPAAVRDAVLEALRAEGCEAVLWQTQPVPGQTLFRRKLGYGRENGGPGCPWDHGSQVNYDLAQYPETIRLLDSSLCLFSQTYPIAPQPPSLVESYAEAFATVWTRLDEVLRRSRKTERPA